MIVNIGKQSLLGLQTGVLATYSFGLFTNNFVITNATVLANLTEAVFAGYARAVVGALVAPYLVSNRAETYPITAPSFINTSGVNQTVFGWFLVDVAGTGLISAVNMGATIIPDGQLLALAGRITDDQA